MICSASTRFATLIALFLATLAGAMQQAGTWLISVSSAGVQGNNDSDETCLSADGRYVVFHSYANNLVPGDANGKPDVFVHDRLTGETSLVSISTGGQQGNADSGYGGISISADGRYVAFWSAASNLVPGDTNSSSDIFVRDRVLGQTTRVSISSSGDQANGECDYAKISADGRYVAFSSKASNLSPGDVNGVRDVFMHDRQTGQSTLVSISSSGGQGNASSGYWGLDVSGDGRYIVFHSNASNLVAADTNGEDIFIHDRISRVTSRASVSSDGEQSDGSSLYPSISQDGRTVAFTSFGTNLVSGDTNSQPDVFVHDVPSGETVRVSVSSSGAQGNGHSGDRTPTTSGNGRFVTFESKATNLVPGDTNGYADVFVHDRQIGITTRISVSSSGEQGDNYSIIPFISSDGRFVAFGSIAKNLVSDDSNGFGDVFVHQYGGQTALRWDKSRQLPPPK